MANFGPRGALGCIFDSFEEPCQAWHFHSYAPPSIASLLTTMQRKCDSGPGPDGIPYSGWAGGGMLLSVLRWFEWVPNVMENSNQGEENVIVWVP